MIPMDVKGIMWIGNVYQKFEAMCLEVEEVMCQDTVKYVEDQVQTVATSVKKFYSEVMQDVLPPSSDNPVNVAATDLSLNPYADFCIHKKQKASTNKDKTEIHKQVAEDSKVKHEPCENYRLDFLWERKEGLGSYEKSNVVTRRKSRSFTPCSKDLGRDHSHCEMVENYEVPMGRIPTELNLAKGSDFNHVEKFSNVCSSDSILPSKSVGKEEIQSRPTPDQVCPDVSSAELNGFCLNDGANSLIGSYVGCDAENSGSTHEGHSSPTDCRHEDFFESDDEISEPRAETIQDFDRLNCVVVGREDLSVAVPKEDKARSYKKKLQKAFLSKRSARKQEYKQLALQQGYIGSGQSQETADSETLKSSSDVKNSQPHGVSESGWELL